MRLRRSFRWLCAIAILTLSAGAFAQVGIGISVSFGPPPLPIYDQPLCPADGYIWTPGYWAWDPDVEDYYWVPGTWVLAPEVGFLWTPPWWGWENEVFIFHEGYWGLHVGFYGGIFYDYGYFGHGYEGGRWDNGRFFYNREVNNINITNIRNVYVQPVTINRSNVNRVAYNGPGGVQERPTPQEEQATRERHLPPAPAQTQHIQTAKANPELRASANRGKPPIAATPRAGALREGAIPAKASGGEYHPPANRGAKVGNIAAGAAGSRTPVHPKELPPISRPEPPNTGDPKRDQKYQQQQDKLIQKQNQERERLQQKQEQEDTRLERQNANGQMKQLVEQRHQQQTQRLMLKHTQQAEHLRSRQVPPPSRSRGSKLR
jgi:hypothetical protein